MDHAKSAALNKGLLLSNNLKMIYKKVIIFYFYLVMNFGLFRM